MGWPRFRKTLGWAGMVVAAAGHVFTRTVELLTHHLLYEREEFPHR